MPTDDKVITRNLSVDDNTNTQDQRRVGIWWAVVGLLTLWSLMALGGVHTPPVEDKADTGPNAPVDVNPPDYSVNKPVGTIEWPGTVGKQQKYLTGKGNTPAVANPAAAAPATTTTTTTTSTGTTGGAAPAGH